MDTTLTLQRPTLEKTATSAASIAILLAFLLVQIPTIQANDMDIGVITGLSPTINYIQEQKEKELEFDK